MAVITSTGTQQTQTGLFDSLKGALVSVADLRQTYLNAFPHKSPSAAPNTTGATGSGGAGNQAGAMTGGISITTGLMFGAVIVMVALFAARGK